MKKGILVIILIVAIMLFVALFHLPIGYYKLLRIVVFIVSITLIFQNRAEKMSFRNIVTALIGILFNPIIPVYLHSKGAWSVIDFVTACWFVFLLFYQLKKRKKTRDLYIPEKEQ